METARGRWFLSEFAQRNRTADTKVLLEAISRLEQAVTGERAAQNMDRVRFDLMEMAKAIARTKERDRGHPVPGPSSRAVSPPPPKSLDAIVRTTERATSDILEAAEHVQETAWTLREKGADEDLCGELDRRATEIYTACSFQDLTAQRTGKIVNTLRYLEGRINAMIDIWGGDERPEPAPERAAQTVQPCRSRANSARATSTRSSSTRSSLVDIESVPALRRRRSRPCHAPGASRHRSTARRLRLHRGYSCASAAPAAKRRRPAGGRRSRDLSVPAPRSRSRRLCRDRRAGYSREAAPLHLTAQTAPACAGRTTPPTSGRVLVALLAVVCSGSSSESAVALETVPRNCAEDPVGARLHVDVGGSEDRERRISDRRDRVLPLRFRARPAAHLAALAG